VEAELRLCFEKRRDRLPEKTTCFRWVDGELEGTTVDLFGRVAVVSFYRSTHVDEERRVAEALTRIVELDAVYVKRRPQEARQRANDELERVAPKKPVLGREVQDLEVLELDKKFLIRPGNGLSVGLYLDSRDARAFVASQTRGRSVLNLFAYTCGFGVAAHRGGAQRVVNVDASRRVLDWGEENLRRNGTEPNHQDFVAHDVMAWLSWLVKRETSFDFIIVDPPGFSTTKAGRFSAQRDYHELLSGVAQVAATGALVLAMCNVEAMTSAAFDKHVQRGLKSRRWRPVRAFGASSVDFSQPSALKCIALEMLEGPPSKERGSDA
jgi:23S rRNA (cytosine1962-C5)-methyltransferase